MLTPQDHTPSRAYRLLTSARDALLAMAPSVIVAICCFRGVRSWDAGDHSHAAAWLAIILIQFLHAIQDSK